MNPTMTEAPPRSLDQRMSALKRANDIRSKRAQLKRDLKAGRVKVAALVVDPPDYALTMKAIDLLMATPKLGRVKTNRILAHCRMAPSKTLGGLTERQRDELATLILNRYV